MIRVVAAGLALWLGCMETMETENQCAGGFCGEGGICINGKCTKLTQTPKVPIGYLGTVQHACPSSPTGEHEMGPYGRKYDHRVQQWVGKRFYNCWEIMPKVQWACKWCKMPTSDLPDDTKPHRWEGDECEEWRCDKAAWLQQRK